MAGFVFGTAGSFEWCLHERKQRHELVRKAIEELNKDKHFKNEGE